MTFIDLPFLSCVIGAWDILGLFSIVLASVLLSLAFWRRRHIIMFTSLFLIAAGGCLLCLHTSNALSGEGCASNLHQLNMAFQAYAGERNGKYPALGKNGLLFPASDFMDEFISDPVIFLCPTDRKRAATGDPAMTLSSYVYIDRCVTTEDDFERYLEGTLDSAPLHAAQSSAAKMPVLIEVPRKHMRHQCRVLFLDGHILSMTPGTEWPLTDRVTSLLQQLAK